jgi:hypothetical protein
VPRSFAMFLNAPESAHSGRFRRRATVVHRRLPHLRRSASRGLPAPRMPGRHAAETPLRSHAGFPRCTTGAQSSDCDATIVCLETAGAPLEMAGCALEIGHTYRARPRPGPSLRTSARPTACRIWIETKPKVTVILAALPLVVSRALLNPDSFGEMPRHGLKPGTRT